MKKFLLFYLLLLFLFSNAVQARTWTDSKGRHLEGDYVGISEDDASKVKIKLASTGKVVSVIINNLSPTDQNYIRARHNTDNFQKIVSNDEGFADDDEAPSAPQRSAHQSPQNAEPVKNDNPNNEVVVVEGIGDSIADAKKDAMRNAVEQVVGALVDAQTRVENDELIEQILTASGAYIEKSEVLSAKKENGLVTIKLRATVVKLSLTKKLKLGGGGQTIAVDGSNLVDMASSKVDAEKSGAMFLANFLKKEEFPYSLLDTKVLGQPQITQKGNEVIYTLTVSASINRERYLDFAKRVKPIFDKYAIQQSSFILETYISSNNRIAYRKVNAPGHDYEGSHLPFYLCTGVTGNFRSIKFETYELPKKFAVPLGYYKRVAPVVEVLLLDGDNEVIATKRVLLGYINWEVEPFNAMPSMFDKEELEEPDSIGESRVLNFRYNKKFTRQGWCVFAPYRRDIDSEYHIISSSVFDVSIVLSPDELAKVRSAKIAVIVNNPEMDKAFKTMESEIEQIPTN